MIEKFVVRVLAIPACALMGVLIGSLIVVAGPRRAGEVLKRTGEGLISGYDW